MFLGGVFFFIITFYWHCFYRRIPHRLFPLLVVSFYCVPAFSLRSYFYYRFSGVTVIRRVVSARVALR